jgi:hypothetical protein
VLFEWHATADPGCSGGDCFGGASVVFASVVVALVLNLSAEQRKAPSASVVDGLASSSSTSIEQSLCSHVEGLTS